MIGMDSTITADRRRAHARVGAAATAAFLALLLLGALKADADPPQRTPAATPTVEPVQPAPGDPGRGFRRPGGGPPGGGGGGGFAPAPDPGGDGGGGLAPAPNSGGSLS